MKLTPEQEVAIFRSLAFKSALETGLEFGFDKHYKDNKAVRNAVTVLYQKVRKEPAKYGVGTDVVQLVCDAMAHRSITKATREVSAAEKEIDSGDIKTMLIGVRDKTLRLIDRKLTRAGKSNKRLDAISFRDLGTIAGIAFDKAQIIQGQATEHVALMGKIEGNIDPEKAIDLVLRMRELNISKKKNGS